MIKHVRPEVHWLSPRRGGRHWYVAVEVGAQNASAGRPERRQHPGAVGHVVECEE